MTKYREIIRLAGLNLSQTNIALSCNASKTTVNKVLKAAREQNLTCPLDPKLTDPVLCGLLFPYLIALVTTSKRMPDYAHIRKELLRNGVNKKLLWTEYLEECRLSGDEPLMYSQFCYHIQQDEQKHRATMHINRKPGEQVEVDWAGDPATIIDPDTGEVLPDGEEGEVVFTCITKEAFPLIRYRTRDISVLSHDQCSCGRTFVKMAKPRGRSDDMLIIRGINVFPSQVEHVLVSLGLEPNYQIIVDRKNNLDTMEVQVEMNAALFSDTVRDLESVEHRIENALQSTLNVHARVRLVEPGSLPRSEGKAKRVIDNRHL